MPELPEVDWMASRLQPWAKNRKIEKIEVLRGNYFKKTQFSNVVGQHVIDVRRRGKYLIFQLEQGIILGHNAMAGYWDSTDNPGTFDYVEGRREASENDVRVRVHFPGLTLRFHDARLFGTLEYYPTHYPDCLNKLGPDALCTPYSWENNQWNLLDAATSIVGSQRLVKTLLMEQEEVAGIGNIYAAEALWAARISPKRTGETITSDELCAIYNAVQAIMRTAIASNLDYPKYLKCYRQKDCATCAGPIARIKLIGRSTYWCPNCQK